MIADNSGAFTEQSITITVTDKKTRRLPSSMAIYEIMKAIEEGRSVIFNVKIDSKNRKIYVTDKAVIVNNIIDVDELW
jgi:hypothetical protein